MTKGATGRRGRGRMEGRWVRREGPRQDGQEGKMCCGEEGSERTPPSHLTILHVQSGQLCVCGGRRVVVYVMANHRLHSKRKKRKALATHHLFFYQSNNLQKEGSPHFWQLTLCELAIEIFQLQVRGPNKAPFAPAFAPFTELCNGCSYRNFENRSRCLYGAKITAPPIPKSARRLLESFFLAERITGGL